MNKKILTEDGLFDSVLIHSGLSYGSNLISDSSSISHFSVFIVVFSRSFNTELRSIRGLSLDLLGVGNIVELIISSRVIGTDEETPAGVNPNADGEKKGLLSISENGVKLGGVFFRIKSGEPILKKNQRQM